METEPNDWKQDGVPEASGNGLRKAMYIVIILFFVTMMLGAAFVVTAVVASSRAANQAIVEPIGNLVQQLTLPMTPTILPNPATIVRDINDLARLETASYEFEKIITADRNSDMFWGLLGESMIFIAHGKVFAGVDFSEMSVADLQVYDPTTVYVHLPEAKIFEDIPVLDNEQSRVLDRDTGLFTSADPELETAVRRAAEDAIREAAQQSEILDRANENARNYMINFLQGVGFENIIFTDAPPDPAPPFTQEVPKGFVLTPPAPQP